MKLFEILKQKGLFSNEIKARIKNSQITINNEVIKSDVDLTIETEEVLDKFLGEDLITVAKCIEASDLIFNLIKEDQIFSIQMMIFGFENLFNSNIDNRLTKKLNEFLLIKISKKEIFLLKKIKNEI